MKPMTKGTIWITRDLKGDERDKIFLWNTKPLWNHENCTYECDMPTCEHHHDEEDNNCKSTIVILSARCSDFNDILNALGIQFKSKGPTPRQLMPVGDVGISVQRAECVKLTTSAVTSIEVSLATKAKQLAQKLKSKKKPAQKELIAFLDSIKDEDEDEEEYEEEYEEHGSL